MRSAEEGIVELQKHVDTLIIIPNQNLFLIANANTTFKDAFAMADQVLHQGVRGITDLMIMPGLINLDFADIRTVMSEMGKAMMGTGEASGEHRAIEAAEKAIANPLLDEVSMRGAKGVIINITGGDDLRLMEVDEAATHIREMVDPEANIIVGSAFNPDLNGIMRVSVVATGIDVVARTPAVSTLRPASPFASAAPAFPAVSTTPPPAPSRSISRPNPSPSCSTSASTTSSTSREPEIVAVAARRAGSPAADAPAARGRGQAADAVREDDEPQPQAGRPPGPDDARPRARGRPRRRPARGRHPVVLQETGVELARSRRRGHTAAKETRHGTTRRPSYRRARRDRAGAVRRDDARRPRGGGHPRRPAGRADRCPRPAAAGRGR